MRKKKPKCPNCGKKVGRRDRLQRKLIEKTSVKISQQFGDQKFKQEFEERREWCIKCLTRFFSEKGREAFGKVKEELVPSKYKGIFKKGKELSEK